MTKEQIKELFEINYPKVPDNFSGTGWNQTYQDAFDKGFVRKEMLEEFQARGFEYVNSKVDSAWQTFVLGFWAGAAAEFANA